jgi:hypothetical protein
VGTNAEATTWDWWLALDSVGCHGGSNKLATRSCEFHGYWESEQQQQQHDVGTMVSHFVIDRDGTKASLKASTELLLVIANFGETRLSGAHAVIPATAAARATPWAVKQAWPVGTNATVGSEGVVLDTISQHELQFVHLVRLKTDETSGWRRVAAVPLGGDMLATVVEWPAGVDVADEHVALEFHAVVNAALYSYWFASEKISLKSDDDDTGTWTGPSVEVIHTNGIAGLLIDGVPTPAFWPLLMAAGAGNKTTPPTTGFDATVAAAAAVGTRLLTLCLTGDCCLEEVYKLSPWYSDDYPLLGEQRAAFDRAVELNPSVLFVVRIYAQLPDKHYSNATTTNVTGRIANLTGRPSQIPPATGEWGDLDDVTISNMDGTVVTIMHNEEQIIPVDGKGESASRMNSISPRWTREARVRVRRLLLYLNKEYPGRIAGIFFSALHTAEFFYPYGAGPNGLTGFPDYSEDVRQGYCATRSSADSSDDDSCKIPLPNKRNTSVFGIGFGDRESVKYNLYLRDNIASAIAGMSNESKAVSDGKIFTMSFFGYNLRVQSQLLAEPSVDGLASVYNYYDITRNFTGPAVPVGLVDAMAVAGKLMMMEDDTRTSICLAGLGPGKHCPETPLDIATQSYNADAIRRNILTLALHGGGQYFGMNGATWFGNASMPQTTANLWSNISHVGSMIVNQLSAAATSQPIEAEVAVFLSDSSAEARTIDHDRGLFHGSPDTDNYQNLQVSVLTPLVNLSSFLTIVRPLPHLM